MEQKPRNAYAVPARMRKNAGAHTHSNKPRVKFSVVDFIEEIEEKSMCCGKCLEYDIVENECTLHGIKNLTSDHSCNDCRIVEEETEDGITTMDRQLSIVGTD